MGCSSEANIDKEAGNRIEFSEQSLSKMEENMNNETKIHTNCFPCSVLLISWLLFFSLSPICPYSLFSKSLYVKRDF